MSASKSTTTSVIERTRRRRRRFDEGETREALLDAAEELFATIGVEGVSIRSINAAAGLAAPSVHYHFGSKDDLLLAVLRRRNAVVTQRLDELLDALETNGGVPSLQELVRAVAGSYLALLKREPVKGMRWLRLMGRLWLAEDPRLIPLNAETGHLTERLLGFVRRMFPDEREHVLESGWRLAVSTLTQMLGNMDTQGATRPRRYGGRASQAYVAMLVEFVASGVAALMTPKRTTTSRAARHGVTKATAGALPKAVPGCDNAADRLQQGEGASREALMDAAEELFAAFGVEGASIRSINAAAGLSAPAVHYHFGSKDELLHAVLRRRGQVVTDRLGERLDALETGGRIPSAHELFTAIANSYLDLLEREPEKGLRWLQLLARLWLAQDPRLVPLDAEMGGLHERLMRLLSRAFPRVPRVNLEKRWRLAASTLLQMLGTSDARVAAGVEEQGLRTSKAYAAMLVDFVAAGFDAVMGQQRSARHLSRARRRTVSR
ncbi:MAG: hypothetical protein H6Q33_2388 [Deltaproteobacteria bacterium]|nr:hypothetical protein [Deltaproteobacteria bacterium]